MKLIDKKYCFFFFFVILMTSHFSGLNAISHSLSQDSRVVRSGCRAWQSEWFVMVRYMMVSSANSLMLLLIESCMSFMYMRKRQGPSTDPWGTPDSTGHAPDCSPSRTIFCDLPDKKDLIHAITVVFMPSRWSFSRSLWWSTLSNALLKSMTMTSVCPPWFKVSYRSWVMAVMSCACQLVNYTLATEENAGILRVCACCNHFPIT